MPRPARRGHRRPQHQRQRCPSPSRVEADTWALRAVVEGGRDDLFHACAVGAWALGNGRARCCRSIGPALGGWCARLCGMASMLVEQHGYRHAVPPRSWGDGIVECAGAMRRSRIACGRLCGSRPLACRMVCACKHCCGVEQSCALPLGRGLCRRPPVRARASPCPCLFVGC
eukprot:859598-Prymnesium_polylepis.1